LPIQQTSLPRQQTGTRQRDMPRLTLHRAAAPHAHRAGQTGVIQ
jgi:hypothetical protein